MSRMGWRALFMGWRALFCCTDCRRLELERQAQYALIGLALFVLYVLPMFVVAL